MINALIVEDEEEICELLKEELEEQGLNVTFVLTGEQALRQVDRTEWHLAIVDLKLGTSVTGLEVIKMLRERWPKCIVVALSGYVDVGLRQETEKLGVQDFLEKPDDLLPKVLVPKIQSFVAQIPKGPVK